MKAPKKSTVWAKCSRYNRIKNADENGFAKCCSCGKEDHFSNMDAGHYIPRSRGKAVFWVPENIHAQCKRCNLFDKELGKIGYTKFMLDTYGREFEENLHKRAREIFRERAADLIYWNDFYKRKLEELEG